MTPAEVLRRSEDRVSCRRFVFVSLREAMQHRGPDLAWIANEREAVAMAANQWATAHGYDVSVTVADVERIEVCAVGHVDYASKLALYVAEHVVRAS